jgi:RNA polymerase sigma-70 factor (ECF subfamily)
MGKYAKDSGNSANNAAGSEKQAATPEISVPAEKKADSKNDLELVRMSIEDANNFGLIIEKYEPKLLRYVTYFTGMGRDAAEDVLQETFLKVFRNLNAFNQSLSFSSWIYRIAHNEAVNYLKKNSGKEVLSLEGGDDDETASLINILQSDENVEHQVDKRQMGERVREVLKLMREDYREILVLKYLEDYDYNEISDILKKPLGTVGVLISRAKDNFRQTAEKLKLNF